MRILGLDYGEKTVGVAVTDPLMLTAQGVETIVRKKENALRETLRRIQEIAAEKGAELIVVGLPLHMDGTPSERSEASLAFAELLRKRTGLPVVMHDERLTTVEADEILAESGVPKERRKDVIDKVAACLILEDYLKTRKKEGETAGLPERTENEG